MVALLRAVKTQREIYARVARTTVDSQALLSSALQLMDTTAVVKEKTARNDDAEKLARQPSPSIDDNTSRMGVGSSETGGRTVQMVRAGEGGFACGVGKKLTQPGINSGMWHRHVQKWKWMLVMGV